MNISQLLLVRLVLAMRLPQSCALGLLLCALMAGAAWGEDAPEQPQDAGKAVAAEKPAAAEEQSLLYVDPFDLVTLDAENNGAVLKVFPIEFPNRRVPKAPQPTDTIEVRLKEHPDQTFEITWKSIKKVKLFEQMLMDEAARLTTAGNFDEAYQYYELLEEKYPKTSGVKEAVEQYLWTDALDATENGQYDQALAMLVELYRRDAKREGLSDAFAKTTSRLVEQSIKRKNYRAARGLLRNLSQRFPDDSAATVKKYEAQLKQRAVALKTKAESQWKAHQVPQAWRSAAAMLDVWPGLEGGVELAREIQAEHPTLVVAVGGLPPTVPLATATASAGVLDDWAQRRARRLLQRELIEIKLDSFSANGKTPPADGPRLEIKGPSANGAEYFAPLGSIEHRPQLALRLRSVTPGVRSLTAPDAADGLVRLADPRSAAFDPAFAEMFARAKIEGIDSLSIELAGPAEVSPGWLTRALSTLPPGDPITSSVPFTIAARTGQEIRYAANPKYALLEPGGPREIVERDFSDSTAALVALRSGQVSIIGRLSPWEAPAVRAADELTVEAFAFPTVHVLVPNRRKPLLANRTFRRALEYAIDRAGILNRALLAGRTVAGSQVVSGPFPHGAGDKDPHGYAYDSKIVPRTYDPSLARLLVGMALEETAAQPSKGHSAYVAGPLVLVHPPEPAAQVACLSIRRQLQAAGVDVTLRELGPDDPLGDFDLAYVELAMQEPAIDVWRFLGPGALGGTPSPYMAKSLADLLAANDWGQVCRQLNAIHQLVYNEVDVIPLWQVVEHLAYSAGVKGIGQRPVTLYDNVEHWQLEMKVPGE
jgi:tetratricopeptide (TPR) repeat protein